MERRLERFLLAQAPTNIRRRWEDPLTRLGHQVEAVLKSEHVRTVRERGNCLRSFSASMEIPELGY